MSTISYLKVHNQFKLYGAHFTREDLCRVAYSFIKEGEDFEKAVGDFLLDWFDDRSYLEMNTSGTTGVPKLIQIEKQAMVTSAIATGDFFGLKPGDKALLCLPVKYIAGKMMFIRSLILGLDVDFVAPSSHPMQNNKSKYDFVAMVPLQAENSLKELKNVKTAIIGGVKMSKTLESCLEKLPTVVYETFGMTETVSHIAARKVGEKAFTIFPNIVISKDNRDCMIIEAPLICNEPICTNDIIDIVNETQFVLLGRVDHLINSGGIKIIPELIEAKLSGLINSRFFITGKKDDHLGEKVVLVIEGEVQSIDESIFVELDKYEKPKEILFLTKFTETHNGKIKRSEMTL